MAGRNKLFVRVVAIPILVSSILITFPLSQGLGTTKHTDSKPAQCPFLKYVATIKLEVHIYENNNIVTSAQVITRCPHVTVWRLSSLLVIGKLIITDERASIPEDYTVIADSAFGYIIGDWRNYIVEEGSEGYYKEIDLSYVVPMWRYEPGRYTVNISGYVGVYPGKIEWEDIMRGEELPEPLAEARDEKTITLIVKGLYTQSQHPSSINQHPSSVNQIFERKHLIPISRCIISKVKLYQNLLSTLHLVPRLSFHRINT